MQLLGQGKPSECAATETTGSSVKRPSPLNKDATANQQAIAAALHELDLAAIMGGPLFRCEVDQLISVAQTLHQEHMDTNTNLLPFKRRRAVTDDGSFHAASNSEPCTYLSDALHDPDASGSSPRHVSVTSFVQRDEGFKDAAAISPRQLESASAAHLLPPGSLQPHATQVPADHLPSLERCACLPCLPHPCTILSHVSQHLLRCTQQLFI